MKKFNLSEIMTYAHELLRDKRLRYTKSTALKTAWTRAKNLMSIEAHNAARRATFEAMSAGEKIEELKGQRFMLATKCGWEQPDYDRDRWLSGEIAKREAVVRLEGAA